MATFIVGFDGKWQEKFSDKAEAIAWAEEVAATGRTVEVLRRRFGFYSFVTGFPETSARRSPRIARCPTSGTAPAMLVSSGA
jgi:hypothetical protein